MMGMDQFLPAATMRLRSRESWQPWGRVLVIGLKVGEGRFAYLVECEVVEFFLDCVACEGFWWS